MRARSETAKESSSDAAAPVVEKAKDALEAVSRVTDQVQERAADVVDTVRAKTGDAQATLADKLEARAQRIRDRVRGDSRPGKLRSRPRRVAETGEVVADRLERSALWLREHDVTDFGELIRYQLELHPGRTALIALGFGILVGRASKRSR